MKVYKVICCLLIAMVFSVAANGQKKFREEADVAFEGEKYFASIELYKKAYSKSKSRSEKAEIIFQIAESYRLSDNPDQAEVWYQKALQAQYPDPIVHLRLGEIKLLNGKYEEAIKEFQEYKAESGGDKRAELGLKSAEEAQEWLENPTRHILTPMVLINSEQYDFSPVFVDRKNESIIFTSTREGSLGSEASGVTGQNFSDLYMSERDRKGKWSEPVLLPEPVNSPASEGAACMDSRKSNLYFTRCGVEKNSVSGCSIYSARKSGTNFRDVKKLPILKNDSFVVGHPAMMSDDETLIFASNMPGGFGGKDLWYSVYKKRERTWTEPVNLGSSINTPYDEMFPFIREDGSLYFSSNGHAGMGGLDIFKAEKVGDKQWDNVENLKHPINSSANDFGIIYDGDKDRGFITSGREGGKGGDDIWEFYIPPLVFALEGEVKNVETGEPVPGATVKLVGTDGTSAEITTEADGSFKFGEKNANERYIKKNTSYSILVQKDDYLNAKGKESTVGEEESKVYFHEYELQAIKDEPIELPLIQYEYNSAELKPSSKDSLDYLYNILIDNPSIVIELRAHTDFRGGNSYNMKLSQERAQSCVDYLVSKGIDPERMKAKGYGETKPLIPESEIKAMDSEEEKEAAHQKNRRTEFTVLSTDYVPKDDGGGEEDEGESDN